MNTITEKDLQEALQFIDAMPLPEFADAIEEATGVRPTLKEDVLQLVGSFNWNYGSRFFIETAHGNFIWNDPAYSGDNTLKATAMDYAQWLCAENIPYARDKGQHVIADYCGRSVQFE